MKEESEPDSLIPPDGGFTCDEFFQMRGLPKGSELIDGCIIFSTLFRIPEDTWDRLIVALLRFELDRLAASDETPPERQIVIRLHEQWPAPEPGVVVVTAEAFDETCGEESNLHRPEYVVLVVEPVYPDTGILTLDAKPRRYATAGVRHFWRVQREGRSAAVSVYERLDSGNYALTGVHREYLELIDPFELEIDLAAVGEPLSGRGRSRHVTAD